jgi:hypothetical protein
VVYPSLTDDCKGSLLTDIPYYCYAAYASVVEFIFLIQASAIVNNSKLYRAWTVGNLVAIGLSQLVKYDLYTDVKFIKYVLSCKSS